MEATFMYSETDVLFVPYIRNLDPIEFKCDGTEGSLSFNGHYYVEDHGPPYPDDTKYRYPGRYSNWLPQKLKLNIKDGTDEQIYSVEIYKRVIHESTNIYGEMEDGMKVCLTPSERQTVFFRVLEKIKKLGT